MTSRRVDLPGAVGADDPEALARVEGQVEAPEQPAGRRSRRRRRGARPPGRRGGASRRAAGGRRARAGGLGAGGHQRGGRRRSAPAACGCAPARRAAATPARRGRGCAASSPRPPTAAPARPARRASSGSRRRGRSARPRSISSTLFVTRSSTWRSWVTSTSPPGNRASQSSSHAMPSRSRWLVGSSRIRRSPIVGLPSWATDADERAGQRHPLHLPAGQGRDVERPPTPPMPSRSRIDAASQPVAHRVERPCPGAAARPGRGTDSRVPRPRRTVPASGATVPASTLRRVDLPPPLMPTTPRRSPLATVTERPSKSGLPGAAHGHPGGVDEDHRGILPDRPRPARTPLGTVTRGGAIEPGRHPLRPDRPRPPPAPARLRTDACPPALGLVVEHRASGVVGSIRSFSEQIVVLRDRLRSTGPLRNQPGGFLVDGRAGHAGRPDPGAPARPR